MTYYIVLYIQEYSYCASLYKYIKAHRPCGVQPYSSLCCTFRYVLRTQPPGESEWTPDFRAKFIDGFKVFLSLLSMMEVSVDVWNLHC